MMRDNLLHDVAQKYFKPQGTVLDFGCNYGHATNLLALWGYNSIGTDVSDEAISYGHSLGIKNIYLSSEKNIIPGSCDAAIALDVLEHIENDTEAFVHLANSIKPGGVIVIMVPAFMFLWGVQDKISHHYRRYTLGSLLTVAEKAGDFEILKKSYFNTFLFPAIAAVRLFTRFLIQKPRESDLDMNSPFINRILFRIFDLERMFLRYVSFPVGVSALLVLRKK